MILVSTILFYSTKNDTFSIDLPFIQIQRLPFDWKNPFNFLIAIAIQCAMLLCGLSIGSCVLAFTIGSYFYAIGLSKTVTGILFSFNRNIQSKADRSILLEQLIEFLGFHSRSKQLSTKCRCKLAWHYTNGGLTIWVKCQKYLIGNGYSHGNFVSVENVNCFQYFSIPFSLFQYMQSYALK